MQKEIVICYRKIFDSTSKDKWEQLVWQTAYDEYCLQVQYFDSNGQYERYFDLVSAVPNAKKLPFLVSGAIHSYLQQLQGKIPDIIDNIGKHFLRLDEYEFEILRADRDKPASFKIAISFYSEPLIWLDTVANYLLLKQQSDKRNLTHLFELRPYVNIHSLKETQNEL